MNLLQQMELYMKRFGKLDEATLKWVGLITMLIDHAAVCFLWRTDGAAGGSLRMTGPGWAVLYSVLRGIGRTAFPVFTFGIAEGWRHTRDQRRYMLRLLLLACISQVPFALVCGPSLNTVWTLTVGALACWMADRLCRSGSRLRAAGGLLAIGLLCAAASVFSMDYGWSGVVLILLFYLAGEHRLPAAWIGWVLLSVVNPAEVFSLGGFLLIQCYNGHRGRQKRFLFYIFYPAHLLLLFLIRCLVQSL